MYLRNVSSNPQFKDKFVRYWPIMPHTNPLVVPILISYIIRVRDVSWWHHHHAESKVYLFFKNPYFKCERTVTAPQAACCVD
jgi:hypothetical protein